MKTAMYNEDGTKVGYKQHNNVFNQDKTIILWFPGCEQPLETDIIETYFDEPDLTHKPILH